MYLRAHYRSIGNGVNATYTLQDTDILDVSSLSLGTTYDVEVTTNYTPTTSSLDYVAYKTQSYIYTTTGYISNESFATDYIQNGRFLALDQGNYSDRFTATSRTRNAYSSSRGIYLVERTDIANWSSSQYVYILENTDDVTPTHRELVVPDISYHLILYRSNDLTPARRMTLLMPCNDCLLSSIPNITTFGFTLRIIQIRAQYTRQYPQNIFHLQ